MLVTIRYDLGSSSTAIRFRWTISRCIGAVDATHMQHQGTHTPSIVYHTQRVQ